jgi:hypothetical protein
MLRPRNLWRCDVSIHNTLSRDPAVFWQQEVCHGKNGNPRISMQIILFITPFHVVPIAQITSTPNVLYSVPFTSRYCPQTGFCSTADHMEHTVQLTPNHNAS